MSELRQEGAPRGERWAWVVGGTRGIGAAIVEVLAEQGWNVIASGRAGGDLAARGDRRWSVGVDVTDDRAVGAALTQILGLAPALDAVVVAARAAGQGSFTSLSDQQWHAALDTKLLGFVRVARHALPWLERSGGSLISIIGSAAGVATAGHPLGCVNAALRHVTRGLAQEWGPKGVRVAGVSPGPTVTDALAALLEEQAVAGGIGVDQVEAKLAGNMYRRKMLQPREVAEVVAFLLGPHGAALNGSIVLADDGATGGCI
jgi:NAD(P)-dependent dehydrogenase (short-subunit alcohol dehydrogenase family)